MAKKDEKENADKAAQTDLEQSLIQDSKDLGPAAQGNPAHQEETGEQTSGIQAPAADIPAPAPLPEIIPDAGLQMEQKKLPEALPEIQAPAAEDKSNAQGSDFEEENVPMYVNDPTHVKPSVLHEHRVKNYGADYVVTIHGSAQQVWSRLAWSNLRGDRGGWKETSPVPSEVRDLKAKK